MFTHKHYSQRMLDQPIKMQGSGTKARLWVSTISTHSNKNNTMTMYFKPISMSTRSMYFKFNLFPFDVTKNICGSFW